MDNYTRFVSRVSAFLSKEIYEIVRQPVLILTLVLGPFLILFFFGVGYRNEPRALRTLFVVSQDNELTGRIEEYASSLGPQLIFVGTTSDFEEAQRRLQEDQIDLIAVIPPNVLETIRSDKQAVITLYHNELDPFQKEYISIFGRVYVGEVNRRVLRFITAESQVNAAQAQAKLDQVHTSAAALRRLLEQCTTALNQSPTGTEPQEVEECGSTALYTRLAELDQQLDAMEGDLKNELLLAHTIQEGFGVDVRQEDALPDLVDIVQNTEELSQTMVTADDYIAQLETVSRLETDLKQLKNNLVQFLDIQPRILVSPFDSQVESVADVVVEASDYFAPAVMVLLLQHLTITFAALSMVRERQLGTMELFYVSPLSAFEALLGKYLSYMLFGLVLAIVLGVLVVYVMGVPMLGSWVGMMLVFLALLFASPGIGFVISLISDTDTQAVQYSMIVLLASVFFSGFLLGLDSLWGPVRIISWTLPATYAILLLRNIMLQGQAIMAPIYLYLVGIGAGFFLAAWVLLRRSMAHTSP